MLVFSPYQNFERATHKTELTTNRKGVKTVRTFGLGHQVSTTKLNFINNTSSCLCPMGLAWKSNVLSKSKTGTHQHVTNSL